MAAAQFDIHDLDHLGLPARHVTIACRHGDMTRVFVRERHEQLPHDRVLVLTTAEEHHATYGCDCAATVSNRRPPRRR